MPLSRPLEELRDMMDALARGSYRGDEYALIHELGEAGFFEAESIISSYLSSRDPALRTIAISVLVLHWRCEAYRTTVERMLQDIDPDVRSMAASALSLLAEGSRDPRALALLLQRIDDAHEKWQVRDSAHDGILSVLGKRRKTVRLEPLRWPQDVDLDSLAEARAVAAVF